MKNVVIFGGSPHEYKYSAMTGLWLCKNLQDYPATFDLPDLQTAMRALSAYDWRDVGVVINATHGGFGENGMLQSILEGLGVRYTNSGVRTSAICMDKFLTKSLLLAHDVMVPCGKIVRWGEVCDGKFYRDTVVKPISGGSSERIVLLRMQEALRDDLHDTFARDELVLTEQFVSGPEFSVAMFDLDVLGCVQIEVPNNVLDEALKYGSSRRVHVQPEVHPVTVKAVEAEARKAGLAAGCRGAYRVDVRVQNNVPFVLEINTQPAMRDESLYVMAAKKTMDVGDLLRRIVADASTDR